MTRLACVEVPIVRMQLVLRVHPELRMTAQAVVQEDKPLSPIIEVNRPAYESGIRAGMKYATALTVAPELQAHTVSSEELSYAVGEIRDTLYRYSPSVEPWGELFGFFWLDASGLCRLWESERSWGGSVCEALSSSGFYARVGIGFTRFGSYVLARSARGQPAVETVKEVEQERLYTAETAISVLLLPEKAVRRLKKLGVKKVRDFLELNEGSVCTRLGSEAAAMHRFAAAYATLPSQGAPPEKPFHYTVNIPGIKNREVLLEHITSLLGQAVHDVRRRGRRIHSLIFRLFDENGRCSTQHVRPAESTCNQQLLEKLVSLRLYSATPNARIERLELEAHAEHAPVGQQSLFRVSEQQKSHAEHALSLIRAELGNDSVRIATPVSAHLPEERFCLSAERSSRASTFSQGSVGLKVPVRRIFLYPHPMERSALRTNTGTSVYGPFRFSPKWWQSCKQETDCNSRRRGRTYYMIVRSSGSVWWVYYDGVQWWLHGRVE